MFENLKVLPADPILGLNQTFQQDANPDKINLSVGVYQNAAGQTPQLKDRVATVMTPGGCGALRMGAELLIKSNENSTVWVSDPTWANHYPLLESAGLKLEAYTYFDAATNSINFDGMMESLSSIPQGDVVLLHGCCHNPTGADLTQAQWDKVIALLAERMLLTKALVIVWMMTLMVFVKQLSICLKY